ncbi:nuclear condensing complex subunit [Phyllosticta capitalensis]|uniref:Nuclear condensing complex subunit n=1 Tax=Phyllosticta capitalensis TaxID=121624 RepID=A0ABR1YGZ0_9PEZI
MPSRVADRRRARASADPEPVKRAAPRARASANAVDIPDEGDATTLREQICKIFGEAQRTTATARKLAVQLRKIQEACAYEPVNSKKQQALDEDFDVDDFNNEVSRCLLRVLPVKKSEPVGDRIIKFVGIFLKYAKERDTTLLSGDDPDEEDAMPTSRLVEHIITQLGPLLQAKDKVVRYRSTQIISHMVNTLDTLDDTSYRTVRVELLKRLHDKEAAVRMQAVKGLGRLVGDDEEEEEDSDSDDDTGGGLMRKLLEVLRNEPAAEVRRSLLLNLSWTAETLPFILERARDLDPAIRKALYVRVLPSLADFRHLSMPHREKLLRWGIRDRDENVRKATARVFRERWLEDCLKPVETGEGEEKQVVEPNPMDALLELLQRIHVSNAGQPGGMAHDAMREFWAGRPDYRDAITFDAKFWEELDPQKAFMARSFCDYCRESGDNKLVNLLDEKLPDMADFAHLIRSYITRLLEMLEQAHQVDEQGNEVEDQDLLEDAVDLEFSIEQLLNIALTTDYADEAGRRTMYSIMRETLADPRLPGEITRLTVEVLRALCGNNAAGEREFSSLVYEAIADVQDTIRDDAGDEEAGGDDESESFHSARSNLSDDEAPKKKRKAKKAAPTEEDDEGESIDPDAVRKIEVNLQCLLIAQCTLQNVHGDLESNSYLITMLNNLVVPAVRSYDAPVRDRGLLCLGLYCIMSKEIAQQNIVAFIECFNKGNEELQDSAIKIVTDILTTFPSLLAPPPPPTDEDASEILTANPLLKPILKIYLRSLKHESEVIARDGAIGASKLMLLNTLREPELLKALTVAYFNPETKQNPGLQQALTYFLPVYCHTRKENAERMASIAVPLIHAMHTLTRDLDEDEKAEMVGLKVIGAQIADWTDPRKLVGVEDVMGEPNEDAQKIEGLGDAHLILAEEILEKLMTPGSQTLPEEEKSTLASMMGKLVVHPWVSPEKVQSVTDLVREIMDDGDLTKYVSDTAGRNAVTKFAAALEKLSAPASEEPPNGVDRASSRGQEQEQADARDDVSMADDDEDVQMADDDVSMADAASVADDESDAGREPSLAPSESAASRADEDDTVVPREREMSVEEQIQQQLHEETAQEEASVASSSAAASEDESDNDTVKAPSPPPATRGRGRPRGSRGRGARGAARGATTAGRGRGRGRPKKSDIVDDLLDD